MGFAGPDWTVRVSLANLPDENSAVIGTNLMALMEDFHAYWEQAKTR